MHMSSPCIFAAIKDLPVNSTMCLVVFDTTNICNIMKVCSMLDLYINKLILKDGSITTLCAQTSHPELILPSRANQNNCKQ